jgi:ABC-type uncharacterized transport system, permease component
MVYRIAVLSGIIAQVFFALIKIFIINAFIVENAGANSPLQSSSMVTYIWLTQAFLTIAPWNVNKEDLNVISTGNIAYELARPVDLFSLMYIKTLTWRISKSLMRAVPILLINMILFPLLRLGFYSVTIKSVDTLILFLVSITISYFLSCMITVFIYAISLYTIDASNFIDIFSSLAFVLSGTILPLVFFPSFMQKVLILQPFKGIIDTPAMILTGQYSQKESFFYIGLQLTWLMVFFIVNYVMFKRSTNKIVIQGG